MYDKDKKKTKLLEHLHKMASVTSACKKAGISRETFYTWKEEDPQFAKQVKEIMEEECLDFAEDCLKLAMRRGEVKAIIYYLNTHGKERGWGEKQELDIDLKSGGKPLKYIDVMPHDDPHPETT